MDSIPIGTIISPRHHGDFVRQTESIVPHQVTPYHSSKHGSPLTPRHTEHAFRLVRKLSEGAHGVVYEAKKCRLINVVDHSPYSIIGPEDVEETDETVAVKLLTGDISKYGIPSVIELDILARLRHRHILSLHQIAVGEFNAPQSTNNGFIPKTAMAIMMPWAEHGDLFKFIKDFSLDFRAKVFIMMQIARGVEFMHFERILHMDLKMENILVVQSNPPTIKVADFGMAVYADRRRTRYFRREAVTITYRPPEMLVSPYDYSEFTDVWSIGIIFLYMLIEEAHIYPSIKPMREVKKFVHKTFNNRHRRSYLDKYLNLAKPPLNDGERALALNFLDKLLNYNPTARPTVKQLLQDPIFNIIRFPTEVEIDRHLPTSSGAIIFRRICRQEPENISLESYLAVNFLIRIAESYNVHIETFFVAMDIFNRSLAYVYTVLPNYYKCTANKWTDGCSIGEILSLAALVCFWIAQKAIEDKIPDVQSIYEAASYHYQPEFITDMEQQLIVNLKGVIYQWNPFLNCGTLDELVANFDYVTNIFRYQCYVIKSNELNRDNTPHLLRFQDIYRHTDYQRRLNTILNNIPSSDVNRMSTAIREMAKQDYRRDSAEFISAKPQSHQSIRLWM